MIWGSQYDAIINWVKNGTDKEKISITSLGNNSSGSVVTTGMDTFSNDSINNIRDLCGNLSEWTLEAYGNGNRIYRGGYYNSKVSPGARYSNSTYDTSNNFGSRMSLYIK